MHDQLETAFIAAAESGAPPKTFLVGPDATFEYGNGRNPFDGATFTAWSHADVAAGRSE